MLPDKIDMTCVTEGMLRDLYVQASFGGQDDFEWAYRRERLRKQEREAKASPLHCEHANEVPAQCKCPLDCYCAPVCHPLRWQCESCKKWFLPRTVHAHIKLPPDPNDTNPSRSMDS